MDIPNAYGVISGFLTADDLEYTNKGIRSKNLQYQVGDPIVDFMDGLGFPESSAYRLSDPFFCGCNSRSKPNGGVRKA